MGSSSRLSSGAFLFLACAALLECEHAKSAPAGQPSGLSVGAAKRAGPHTGIWDDSLGPIIATLSSETGAPVLFWRDTARSGDVDVELFSHDGQTVHASLRSGAARPSCPWERSGTLTPSSGWATPVVWSLALAPGVATPLAIDGIGDLLPRDSAALAARISRLVSALGEDSASVPFHGLPIVVRDAWRFRLGDSSDVSVAVVSRTLNVESNPRAELTTLIAEPDRTSSSGAWRSAFSRRDAGPEDRVEGSDLLAAFLLHATHPAVALLHESESGVQVDIVERTAPGEWRVRWSTAALPCARR